MRRRPEALRAESRRLARRLKRNRAAQRKVLDAFDLAHLNQVSAMSELATSIAHELNQPLAAILTNAQAALRLLAHIPPDIAEARAALEDIVADDRRAGKVIQRLRAALPRGAVNVAAQDVNELARAVIPLVSDAARLAGATLRAELEPGLPRVRGDGLRLQQAILHLLVNALDAVSPCPPDARLVVVRTRAADRARVELCVADSGEGVPPEDLERIFEPFFTTKAQGLGVGLSISRSIVEAHGGRLWAECSPGAGVTLRCALPVWDEGARRAG
ncbi:sensor histidine kinase [Sorangium sp. So ce1151]|uniref:sensor histidine kinase n=1 Tax=Sorangium sp. So ce1151 TaxID=3133332 RepID=UPI003F642851